MNIPEDLKYTETHEWVRVEGDIATVGITDHAQSELSDVVYFEPPAEGRQVVAREACAVVESVKAASDIYAPIDGEIVAANSEVSSNPALINTDPFGSGWLFRIKIANPAQLDSLKSPADYRSQIGA